MSLFPGGMLQEEHSMATHADKKLSAEQRDGSVFVFVCLCNFITHCSSEFEEVPKIP